MEQAQWDALHQDFMASLQGKDLYVLDCYAGADPEYRLPVRIISEYAWHNLFCRNLFIDDPAAAAAGVARVHGHRSPELQGRSRSGTARSTEVVIALNFAKKLVLIGGTSYAGEMKKSIFSVLNYVLPLQERPLDALLGQHRHVGRRGALLRPVRHRQDDAVERSRTASSSATTSTAGAIAASSTSRAAATRRRSSCRPRPSRRSTRRPAGSARCSRTWCSTR